MKENCAECKHHDVFWSGSGCILLNNGDHCRFENKEVSKETQEWQKKLSV